MLRTLFIACLLLPALCAAGTPEQLAIERAKARASYDLKDPASAQFREVRAGLRGKNYMVCGEMNAKNAYGAYVGFQPFLVWGEIVFTSGYTGDPVVDRSKYSAATSSCTLILDKGNPAPMRDGEAAPIHGAET